MATDSVEIANSALTLVGSRKIVALSDTSKEARECNANFDQCRKAVLRMHPWNFATKRVQLTLKTITSAVDNGSGLIKVTAVGHGFSTGNSVTVDGIIGTNEANDTWTVTVVDVDNFTLDDSTFINTYVSGGVAGLAPPFGFKFKHALPTDFIRVHSISDDSTVLGQDDWRLEAGYLLTDFSIVNLRYIYNLTTTTQFDPLFDQALAHYLALKICFIITGSESQKENLERGLRSIMQSARFNDSVEEPSQPLDADDWTKARVGVNRGFVRDPGT